MYQFDKLKEDLKSNKAMRIIEEELQELIERC